MQLSFQAYWSEEKDGMWTEFLTNSTHNHPLMTASIYYRRQLVEAQKLELLRLHKSPVWAFLQSEI